MEKAFFTAHTRDMISGVKTRPSDKISDEFPCVRGIDFFFSPTFSMMIDIRPFIDWFRPRPGPKTRENHHHLLERAAS